MALFLSTYLNKLDKKGRISVPAQFRSALATQTFSGIIAYPSFVNPCIEACGFDRIEKLSSSIDNLDPFSEERDAFAATILGACVQLAFDGDGRVTLSDALIVAAEIEEGAIFVGKGPTFEIWNPAKFEIYSTRAKEIALENRQVLSLKNGGVL